MEYLIAFGCMCYTTFISFKMDMFVFNNPNKFFTWTHLGYHLAFFGWIAFTYNFFILDEKLAFPSLMIGTILGSLLFWVWKYYQPKA